MRLRRTPLRPYVHVTNDPSRPVTLSLISTVNSGSFMEFDMSTADAQRVVDLLVDAISEVNAGRASGALRKPPRRARTGGDDG